MKELFTKIIENNYLGGQMLQLFIHNIIGSIYSSNKTIFSSKQETDSNRYFVLQGYVVLLLVSVEKICVADTHFNPARVDVLSLKPHTLHS